MLEAFFNKVAGLKRLNQKYFSMIFLETCNNTLYNKTPYTIKIAYDQSKSTVLYRIK